ncbi:MAG: hypothetical protein Hyperionvirus11_10 [Hyperionvirus sp.]|uniref:Uncharacterized protein n=1 Tax=Hyperionvirus sp. TaxID=2487770 RepID=A0A3G5A900_9VIRU|nr:MAG: hypothetical protein Hyperionvirus11_10 [Hyperionvirus sp.]
MTKMRDCKCNCNHYDYIPHSQLLNRNDFNGYRYNSRFKNEIVVIPPSLAILGAHPCDRGGIGEWRCSDGLCYPCVETLGGRCTIGCGPNCAHFGLDCGEP